MIKGFALVAKKPGIADEQFHRHWREVHAPLAMRIKELRRYVQSHRTSRPVPGFDRVPYDGAAEIWFDDFDTLLNLPNNPQYITGAKADEANFVDLDKLEFLATREHVLIDTMRIDKDTPLTKVIFLLHRRKDMTVAEFQDYWLHGHAPQIPRDAGIVRYVQCHQLPETYAAATPAYDGVAELSFANDADFDGYWNSERIQAIFAADAPRFLDAATCTAFLVEENRVIWP